MSELSTNYDPSFLSPPTNNTLQEDQEDVVTPNILSDSNATPDTMDDKLIKKIAEIYKPVLYPKFEPPIQEMFIPLQKWEGTVQQVADDYFEALLVDQTDKKNQDEVAEFMLDEVSDADLDLVKPGSIFYWNIGYEISPAGQRKRASIIRFRRLPKWSAHEIEMAKNDAKRTRDILNWK